jgi:hypothetical protein
MRQAVAAAIITLAISGCREQPPPFFRQSSEAQVAQARTLPTRQVYELYKQSFDLPPPPLYVLADTLGERGREAIDLWVADIASTGALSEEWEYSGLLMSVKEQTGETICQDPRALTKAANALALKRKATVRATTNQIRRYC